jgi:hypothetical protein
LRIACHYKKKQEVATKEAAVKKAASTIVYTEEELMDVATFSQRHASLKFRRKEESISLKKVRITRNSCHGY